MDIKETMFRDFQNQLLYKNKMQNIDVFLIKLFKNIKRMENKLRNLFLIISEFSTFYCPQF